MADFVSRGEENIKQNQILLKELKNPIPIVNRPKTASKSSKRKVNLPRAPTRQSKRIAEASTRPSYDNDEDDFPLSRGSNAGKYTKKSRKTSSIIAQSTGSGPESNTENIGDVKSIIDG
ncbi:hypothetical protein RAB80_014603 [Fusarium oxysporum f. sp. vasinfectum]|nr:hypothetical protein FOMA001_g13581 [Fusarium oxysporum f. sp. matthiolae]KAK2669077.1 hypothetical protein RAB80_014603 [Fusarium oxysporum f. sp. vasinfectum]KAK2926375.1 hypothetical protein FoTM2_013240 [Fusarium oxysporum f. sp. vasinfectum]